MRRIIRATRLSAAPAVVAVALLAACGGDSGNATSTAPKAADAPAMAWLEAQAEQHERLGHLHGQATTYGASAEQPDAARPEGIEAGNLAVAEQLERSAKLEGQARTHSNAD